MRLSLTLLPLLACCGIPASRAAEEFRLTGRAGLLSLPGYEEGKDTLYVLRDTRVLSGYSRVAGRQAAWVLNPADGVTRRVGVAADGASGESRFTAFRWLTDTDWTHGYSEFVTPGGLWYRLPWVADGITGRTMPAGLSGPGFTLPSGARVAEIRDLKKSGHSWGVSDRYEGALRWTRPWCGS